MGILNPVEYRYQYSKHGGIYTLYYVDADNEQRVIGENLTAEQMEAVLSVLIEKDACDIPYSWKYIHAHYSKQLQVSGSRIRSMLYNLVNDHSPIVFKRPVLVFLNEGEFLKSRLYVHKLSLKSGCKYPVAYNGDDEFVVEDCVDDSGCAALLQAIVDQRLVEIR